MTGPLIFLVFAAVALVVARLERRRALLEAFDAILARLAADIEVVTRQMGEALVPAVRNVAAAVSEMGRVIGPPMIGALEAVGAALTGQTREGEHDTPMDHPDL